MGESVAVVGDKVTGMCVTYLILNLVSGASQSASLLPFIGLVMMGVCMSVLISDTLSVVVGAFGVNTLLHVGLHLLDSFFALSMQQTNIIDGSTSVLFGGTPAARIGSGATCCGQLVGILLGSATIVLIGG